MSQSVRAVYKTRCHIQSRACERKERKTLETTHTQIESPVSIISAAKPEPQAYKAWVLHTGLSGELLDAQIQGDDKACFMELCRRHQSAQKTTNIQYRAQITKTRGNFTGHALRDVVPPSGFRGEEVLELGTSIATKLAIDALEEERPRSRKLLRYSFRLTSAELDM